MRAFLVGASMIAAVTTATAQPAPAPQPFAPIVINEADYNGLKAWLMQQPFQFANPVMIWIETQAEVARQKQRADAAAAAKAKEDPPKPEAAPEASTPADPAKP